MPINGTSISHPVPTKNEISCCKNGIAESKNEKKYERQLKNGKLYSEIESVHPSRLNDDLCVSTACPMCSLHYDVDHIQTFEFPESKNEITLKENHGKNSVEDDMKNNNEAKISENSISKQHIQYVVALPVNQNEQHRNNELVKNIPGEGSASYCQCHESQMELKVKTRTAAQTADCVDEKDVTTESEINSDNLKKRGAGVRGCNVLEADRLTDCHVPKICVQLARYVNPF